MPLIKPTRFTKKPKPKRRKKAIPTPNPVGRPTKYQQKYCQDIIDYFSVDPADSDGNAVDPPYILNFCLSIGINKTTLHEWVSNYSEFSNAYSIAKEKQSQLMVTNALQGRYNPGFAWRAMMNMHGWRDKSDNIHTGKDGMELFPKLTEAEQAILGNISKSEEK